METELSVKVGFVEALLDFCATPNHCRAANRLGVIVVAPHSESVGTGFHAGVAKLIVSHPHLVCAVVLQTAPACVRTQTRGARGKMKENYPTMPLKTSTPPSP